MAKLSLDKLKYSYKPSSNFIYRMADIVIGNWGSFYLIQSVSELWQIGEIITNGSTKNHDNPF